MDIARTIVGILLIVGAPPAVAFWLAVHPFAQRWRTLNIKVTYALLAVFMTGLGAVMFALHEPLMGPDLGTNWVLVGIGAVLYFTSVWLSLLCRKHLTVKTFAGVPEVSGAAYPGRLLQEGIYGVIRHPRYLSVILGVGGMALIVNYLGAYIVVAVCLLGLWPLIVLEERELTNRFGQEYLAYRSRIPALIPRRRSK